MTGFIRVLMVSVVISGALLLSACAVTEGLQRELFDTTKVNLTDSTYAAADMLAQQTKTHMSQNTPLRTMVLTDVSTPNETTAFGTQVANQLGSRFVQLGYNVQALPMSPGMIQSSSIGAPIPLDGAMHPTTNAAAKAPGKGGDCVISGNYTRMKDTLLVSLRIIRTSDQRVIAAYDYTLPMTREIDALSMTADQREKRMSEPPPSNANNG